MKNKVEQYNLEVSDFFALPEISINVHFLKSRTEYNEVAKRKTNDWEVGFSEDSEIYILEKDIFESESTHPASDFEKVLKHETSHVYFDKIRPDMTPYWLNEGIACFLADQNNIKPTDKVTIETLKNYHENVDEKVYMVGRYMVEHIVDKFGKQKLIELIQQKDTEALYAELQNMFEWL